MSNEADAKRLTVEDPIDASTLKKFEELENTRARLGSQLIDIEAEKVKIMVAARRIDEERQRMFDKTLSDRGINPATPVEVDAATGRIRILAQTAPQAEAAQPAAE